MLADRAAVGMASAQGGITLDGARASGNATLFDGVVVQTDDKGFSRIQLDNGVRLDVALDSKVRVFANSAVLLWGMSEIQGGTGFEVEAMSLRIRSAQAGSIGRIRLTEDKQIQVTALNAPILVMNRGGLLVARVVPGSPLSFLPQAATSTGFSSTGCVLQKSGVAILAAETGNQVFELRGADLRKAVGNKAAINGTIDAAAEPAGGTSQVINVTGVTVTKRGGCSDVAAKLGATTAVAGLAAGVAGAGAATAAAATGAGVVAVAGISTTVLVVGGVAAAAAAGLGSAAATGAFSSTSP